MFKAIIKFQYLTKQPVVQSVTVVTCVSNIIHCNMTINSNKNINVLDKGSELRTQHSTKIPFKLVYVSSLLHGLYQSLTHNNSS